MKEAATRAPLTAQNYKSSYKPIWCPGCGDYSVLSSVTKALAMVQVPPEDVVVVSGIGCSSRIPAYTTCYGFHGVHGRALAAATAAANHPCRARRAPPSARRPRIGGGVRS